MTNTELAANVGMLTGIAGVLISIGNAVWSSKRINKLKSLDLRIELRKASIDVRKQHNNLFELMEKARDSHTKRFTAKSSHKKEWLEDFEVNHAKWSNQKNKLPDKNSKYERLSPKELENKLIEIHSLKKEIESITDIYVESLRKDEENGRQLKNDKRVILSKL